MGSITIFDVVHKKYNINIYRIFLQLYRLAILHRSDFNLENNKAPRSSSMTAGAY